MPEREEGRTSGLRRAMNGDAAEPEDDDAARIAQPLHTLKEGFSWIRALESRHPGWHLPHVEGFPFALLRQPLAASRVCMISLAGVYLRGQKPFNTSPGMVPAPLRAMRFRDRGDWSVREIPVDCEPSELMIAHAHYDHREANEDINCVFPLARLWELEVEGTIGECAPVHYSLMGHVPEVKPLLDTALRQLLPRLKSQEVDAAVVSGGCELSHQSAALIQREIESAGIPTVAVSVCRDISYALQVPRAVALRFPLGNPFGAAMDTPMHSRILKDALARLESAATPGEVIDLAYEWIKV